MPFAAISLALLLNGTTCLYGPQAVHGVLEPANELCPIGHEPIDPKAPTVTYKGREIGFCCPGCDKEFLAWSDADKDAFVATIAAARLEPANRVCPITRQRVDPSIETMEIDGVQVGFSDAGARREFKLWEKDAKSAFAARAKVGADWGDPYPLATCAGCGGDLDFDAEPVLRYHEGRQVRFCCEMCVAGFEKDPAKTLARVDAAIVESQRPLYPLTTCIVAGDELGDKPVELVFRNRLVRLCCAGCIGAFNKDPLKYLEKLDAAVIESQSDDYPLTTCVVVPADTLGDHKEPYEVVVANHLVRLCCPGCEESLMTNPAKYLAKIDEAREKARK